MTKREYELAKRFIKRNWENLTPQAQIEIAQKIGGIRHYTAFLEGMRFWLENDCEFGIDRDYEPMLFEFKDTERIVPLPLSDASEIRGANHKAIILDDAVNIHGFSDEDMSEALKKYQKGEGNNIS